MTAAQVEQRRRNVEQLAARRRAATHCKRDHELTAANVYVTPDGRRQCRTCANDRQFYRYHGLGVIA